MSVWLRPVIFSSGFYFREPYLLGTSVGRALIISHMARRAFFGSEGKARLVMMPEHAVVKPRRSCRTVAFYLGAIFALAVLISWNASQLQVLAPRSWLMPRSEWPQ